MTQSHPGEFGIIVDKPKFPMYALLSRRLESFANWPDYVPVTKHDLAEAGLVYTGVADSVRCFFCGMGFRKWEVGDIPFTEHAKWAPRCPFILLSKSFN